MSDTPRTDQEAFYADCEGTRYYCPQMGNCVSSDFARELERENANLRDALEKLLSVAEPMDGIELLRQACAEARSSLSNVQAKR